MSQSCDCMYVCPDNACPGCDVSPLKAARGMRYQGESLPPEFFPGCRIKARRWGLERIITRLRGGKRDITCTGPESSECPENILNQV